MPTTIRRGIGTKTKAISGATNASPIVLTLLAGHGFQPGELAYVIGVTGNTAANSGAGSDWVIGPVTATTVALVGSSGNGAYISGGTIKRRYQTPADWDAATDADVVPSDRLHVGEVHADSLVEYSSTQTIGGATVDATRYRVLKANIVHRFVPHTGAGARFFLTTGSIFFDITEQYFRFEAIGLEVESELGVTNLCGLRFSAANCRADSVHARIACGSASSTSTCFLASAANCRYLNCIAEGAASEDAGAFIGFQITNGNTGTLFYACTAWGFRMSTGGGRGFSYTGTSIFPCYLKNCAAIECDIDFNTGFTSAVGSNCMSSDTSATFLGSATAQTRVSAHDAFRNVEAHDFRPAYASPGVSAGVDLSADAIFVLTTDFIGKTWAKPYNIGSHSDVVVLPDPSPITDLVQTIGSGGDYATPALWEVATRIDCVTPNQVVRGRLLTTEAVALAAKLVIKRAITDATRYRVIEMADGSKFDPSTGYGGRLTYSVDGSAIEVMEPHSRLADIAVSFATVAAAPSYAVLRLRGRGSRADRCYVQDTAGSGTRTGIRATEGRGQVITNALVKGTNGSGAGMSIGIELGSEESVAAGCSVALVKQSVGVGIGIISSAVARVTALNCAVCGSGSADFSGFSVIDLGTRNLSSDATAPGLFSIKNETAADTWNNPTSTYGDLRPKVASALLSAGQYAFNIYGDDYAGNARTVPWSIGGYEEVAGAIEFPKHPIICVARMTNAWRAVALDGTIMRVTDHDASLVIDGEVYGPAGAFDASAQRFEVGLAESSVEASGPMSASGITFAQMWGRRWNGARVDHYIVDWLYPWAGKYRKTTLILRSPKFDGERFTIQAMGLSGLLQRARGKFHLRDCPYDVGDDDCMVDMSARTAQDEVTSVTDSLREFSASALSGSWADDTFNFGKLIWTSGANIGIKCQVDDYTQATRTIKLRAQTPFAIANGDDFVVSQGCDRKAQTCKDKFFNYLNYGGKEHMPGTHKVMQSPTS